MHVALPKGSCKKAFTLAEVLITLGITEVVAALLMPSLISSYQKKLTVNRLKATYSQFAQAIARSEVDNGNMSEWDLEDLRNNYGNSSAIKVYVQKYIEPYLNIIYDSGGFIQNESYQVYIRTLNGKTSVSSARHYCNTLNNGVYICYNANFGVSSEIVAHIDINGKKLPNTYGIDIFHLTIYPKLGMRGGG